MSSGRVFSWHALEHATAGSAGTMLATLMLYPLDRLKTLMQVQPDAAGGLYQLCLTVVREEGFAGLYRGCPVMLQTVGSSNFLYFFLFEGLKERLTSAAGLEDGVVGPKETLLASAIAGVLNMAVTEPLWRACVVLQARTGPQGGIGATGACSSGSRAGASPLAVPAVGSCGCAAPMGAVATEGRPAVSISMLASNAGVLGTVCQMWAQEGPRALWRGLTSSLWLVSNPVIQFFVYDALKAQRPDVASDISSVEAFSMGAIAKAVATVATFPLQVAQSRLRAAGSQGAARPELRGMVPCLLSLLREKGFAGLFIGLLPKLLQTVTQAAFMFVFYEKMHWLIRRLSRKAVRRLARRIWRRMPLSGSGGSGSRAN